VLNDGGILTGSRDHLIKWWMPSKEKETLRSSEKLEADDATQSHLYYEVRKTFKGHTHFVASMTSLQVPCIFIRSELHLLTPMNLFFIFLMKTNRTNAFSSEGTTSSLFASGSNDKLILVWTAGDRSPLLLLIG